MIAFNKWIQIMIFPTSYYTDYRRAIAIVYSDKYIKDNNINSGYEFEPAATMMMKEWARERMYNRVSKNT